MSKDHKFSFSQFAGVRQVQITSGEDIRALSALPQELWTVLNCPCTGLHYDAATLALLDSNSDGNIRASELISALEWTLARVGNADNLFAERSEMKLSELADSKEGRDLKTNARKFILGDPSATSDDTISLELVLQKQAVFLAAPFNGDGVVPPDSAENEKAKKLLQEIVDVTGGANDRNGKKGITAALVTKFMAEAKAYLAWSERAQKQTKNILPLGFDTAAAFETMKSVKPKLDDYFAKCRLESFDASATDALNKWEFSQGSADAPLALTAPGKPLPLNDELNPAWSDAIARLAETVIDPLLGKVPEALTEAMWEKVQFKLAGYGEWQAACPNPAFAKVGEPRIREIIMEGTAAVDKLIALDAARAGEIDILKDWEKLLRLHCNINRLLHNYVNLMDFYKADETEIFRAGRLYMDGRFFDLCVNVADFAAHSAAAANSKIFLIYCQLTNSQMPAPKTICAAVTAGFAGDLYVGRHGIFYDRDGIDWNATITKIIESPVSIKEAFWSPWIKISQMLSNQIKKLLESREAAAMSAAETAVTSTGAGVPAAEPTGKKMEGAALASSVAAIGIAVGLVGSAIGSLVSVVSGLPLWKTLLGVLAVFLIVSGPSAILAWFKLRARDIGPILNACGWAVNMKLKMTLRLGAVFTKHAELPAGANLTLGDPYVTKRSWIFWALLIILLILCIAIAVVCIWPNLLSFVFPNA